MEKYKVYSADLVSENKTYAIVISRFNEFINTRLLDGCIDGLKRHGVEDEQIEIIWTPGAFEVPLVAKKAALSDKYNAIITLATVIRGATSHYDYVCQEVSKGVAAVGLDTQIPVIFGVLTTDSIEQAIERAGTKAGNKGYDAAVSAIEMANLMEII